MDHLPAVARSRPLQDQCGDARALREADREACCSMCSAKRDAGLAVLNIRGAYSTAIVTSAVLEMSPKRMTIGTAPPDRTPAGRRKLT